MEHVLIKMARQLDALDEASLLALWDKYAFAAAHFEPTKRWEEAALVFSFIQAKRWKNQLFNYSWSAQVQPDAEQPFAPVEEAPAQQPGDESTPQKPKRKAVVIPFRPRRRAEAAEPGTEK